MCHVSSNSQYIKYQANLHYILTSTVGKFEFYVSILFYMQ